MGYLIASIVVSVPPLTVLTPGLKSQTTIDLPAGTGVDNCRSLGKQNGQTAIERKVNLFLNLVL